MRPAPWCVPGPIGNPSWALLISALICWDSAERGGNQATKKNMLGVNSMSFQPGFPIALSAVLIQNKPAVPVLEGTLAEGARDTVRQHWAV